MQFFCQEVCPNGEAGLASDHAEPGWQALISFRREMLAKQSRRRAESPVLTWRAGNRRGADCGLEHGGSDVQESLAYLYRPSDYLVRTRPRVHDLLLFRPTTVCGERPGKPP